MEAMDKVNGGKHDQQRRVSAVEQALLDEMNNEKKRYPGASDWARDEERLFEVMFLRQHLPLMPAHWNLDLSRVPLDYSLFDSSADHPPVIYAHSTKEFQATQALIRLIELTSQVRTDCQSGFRRKAPGRIHKGIDQFIKWASEDGGYMNLRYVPNITVATVDDSLNETGITLFMEQHMHALARLQREFLKEPPDAAFWDGHDQGAQSKSLSKTPLLQKFLPRGVKSPSSVGRRLAAEDVIKYELVHNESPVKAETIERGQSNFRGLCKTADDELYQDLREETPVSVKGEETVSCTAILATLPCKKENASQERDKGTVLSPIDDEADESERGNPDPKDGDYEPSEGDGESAADDISVECPSTREVTPLPSPVECDAPETPRRVKRESSDNDGLSQWATQYRRRPPVVYGLFVLRTSVFLLTVDSAKGETATVSFHEDMHFADFKRSLWNGLTVAIAVCLARDELMSRRDDFELMVMHDESDPDA